MFDAWIHSSSDLYTHLASKPLTTKNDIDSARNRIVDELKNDIPRFYPSTTDRDRIMHYIIPRLKSNFHVWSAVGCVLTQAGLALPYITLARHTVATNAYVIHPIDKYCRVTCCLDYNSVVYSNTFHIMDKHTMHVRTSIVMHASFGWTDDGSLTNCHVTIQSQIPFITPSKDVC